MGVKYWSAPSATVQNVFEHIFNIPLQVENVGGQLTSLESDFYLATDREGVHFVGARVASKFSTPDAPGKFECRYPKPHVPHARRTVANLVPVEAKRAVYYRVTKEDLHSNVRGIVATFDLQGYPTGCRKPLIHDRLHKWGLCLEDCYGRGGP